MNSILSTAQPYLASDTFYCCNRHCERVKAKCGNLVFFRDESEEHRVQRSVLAGEGYTFNKLYKPILDCVLTNYYISFQE